MNTAPPVAGVDAARVLATELKRRWRRGEPPDAAGALAEHPDLARHKSIVVDLAYEEYLLREKAGAAPDPGPFADRFPAFRASIRNMLDAHQLLTERPDLLDPTAGAWPEAGCRFEGLELLGELGRGAFGRAYLAFDPGTDRLCALKLTAGRSSEARVIGRLAHPHVTDVYWARVVGGRTVVCMPFVGVSTLADVISEAFPRPGGPPPPAARVILDAAEADGLAGHADRRAAPVVRPSESYLVGACAVAARIADAVAYLHSEGVVHGDLKPSNVVVGPGGSPHLIDFNLSTGDGAPTAVRGTPAYMAPELLEAGSSGGTTAGVDAARADLFSLGAVVVELLSGERALPPAGPDTLGAWAEAARHGVPALPAALPPAVVSVLTSCLAPDPTRRPTSAREVATALDRFVHDRRNRGRWRRVAIAVAGLALLGSGLGVGVNAWLTPSPGESVTMERSPETADEFLARGRKYLRAGDVTAARSDFFAAYDRSKDPWALALAAYGMAIGGRSQASIETGQRAIKEGAASAEVYNNVGYALSQSPRPADAIPYLDEALRLSPRMRAALYNRAIARYRAGLGERGRPPDPRAAEDITAALAAGDPSPDLRFDAARIYAHSSAGDAAFRDPAFGQIRAAIRTGKDPVACRNDAVLKAHLGGDPLFESACATTRGRPPDQSPQLRLVEPHP